MPADTAFTPRQPEKAPQSELLNGLRIDLQPPPFSEVHEGADYTSTSVTVELNNSVRVKGKLLSFDTSSEMISVMENRAAVSTVMDMSAIKFMRLEKPYQLILSSGSGTPESGHEGTDVESDSRSFEVYFKDRTEITGKT
jgi:hypothetical protein